MRLLRYLVIASVVPLLTLALIASGCGKKEEKKGDTTADKKATDEDKKASDEEKKAGDEDKKAAANDKKDENPAGDEGMVNSTGWGSLSGTVTFVGDIPERKEFDAVKKHKDAKLCEMGDVKDQTWMVYKKGDKKVIANVVVFLKAPSEKRFKLPDTPFWKKVVDVDQPFCAFIPHVQVAFPQKWDPKKGDLVPTGQTIEILNSAKTSHNTAWKGDELLNAPASVTSGPGDKKVIKLNADPGPIKLSCNVHPWMRGYIWALDHPYVAVTKEDGTYTIPVVPAGAEVHVVVWQEGLPKGGFLDGPQGKKVTLKAGKNTMDFVIKK